MEVNSDLHIHSRYSAATSTQMNFPVLAEWASKKGIELIGTGDCLHPKWLDEIKALERIDDGTFVIGNTHFVLTCEVEDSNRVHHLLILPSISKAEELHDKFANYSLNINSEGRPKINLDGEQIAEHAKDAGALFGPCHAFTPWTSMYAYFDSIEECYGSMASNASFIELGLSADSDYADRIEELKDLTFLTNSDAHSPWPIRFAREFNRFELESISYAELKKAILRVQGRRPLLNVGIPPEEGKYNESACIRCYKHYTLKECLMNNWKCRCGGTIKKGVRDRVNELADYAEPKHPLHRPAYLKLIPLIEIIALALNANVNSRVVMDAWNALMTKFGNEVKVLVDAKITKSDVINPSIYDAIMAFRNGQILLSPGGGGRYGCVELPGRESMPKNIAAQSSLFDF
ncbi:MAG: TIGR00375 family protein [Methanocellales archaeon]|nr:TIGR00375 family protein [Methanocellales archaeon]MDD3290960.1 TIGR00375 family protein [Methanocellales archaeon]MDD5234845.1 TIGR00375 family protein [Methanocellales archaeon]MDD5484785.1 TIGR00375 family protein [Methanocellales archaeon]